MGNSQRSFRREWYFDNPGDLADFTEAGDTIVALNNNGLYWEIDTATEVSLISFGAIHPYKLADLKFVEYVFKITASGAETQYTFGITDSGAEPDPDAHARTAFMRIVDLAVQLGYDDNVNTNKAIATGETARLDEWYVLRLDFAQDYQTVSPPSRSRGSQMTAHLTDIRGFQSRLNTQVAVDMHDNRALHFAPFVHAEVITGGSTGECELYLRSLCLELNSPESN